MQVQTKGDRIKQLLFTPGGQALRAGCEGVFEEAGARCQAVKEESRAYQEPLSSHLRPCLLSSARGGGVGKFVTRRQAAEDEAVTEAGPLPAFRCRDYQGIRARASTLNKRRRHNAERAEEDLPPPLPSFFTCGKRRAPLNR